MEKDHEKIIEEIRKLTDGYHGADDLFKRLDWLKNLLDSYRRYLPARVVEKIKVNPFAKRIEGERRNVTVVFADLSGFTALSESMDAEDIANIINEFFTRMVAVVHKYGGSVDKFLGDALMVLFGAPVAHHDDPERAVRASLEMQQEMVRFNAEKNLKTTLSMSVGINTGPVVALNVGAEERMEYTVIGDTVNLAARLEGVSQAGEIIISNYTYEHIADITEAVKKPSVKVKGKRKPVINYLVKGMREHSRLPEITKLKIVGRTEELKNILECLNRSKKNEPMVLAIVGDPGTGKTRLGLESEMLALKNSFLTLRARCMPYETNMPYTAFISLFGNFFELKKESNAEEKKLIISLKLKNAGLDLDNNLPFIGLLYDIFFPQVESMALDELKKKIFQVIKDLLRNTSEKSPLFVRVEDFQWCDPTSIELFDFLVRTLANVPIAFVFECRSDYAFPWLDLKNCRTIILKNFSQDETESFCHAALGEEIIAKEIKTLLYNKSQGNPLFLAEIIKLMLKKGGIRRTKEGFVATERFKNIDIAESVSSLILDQIDRMGEMDRRILQYASVIGKIFNPALLTAVLGMPVSELSEYLQKLEHFDGLLVSAPDVKTYEFISPTTYEVIYSSLLKTRRRELHSRIGEELEKTSGDRISEYLEPLAYHFARSSDERKGVFYLKNAADKSYHLYALKETINFFEQAIDLLKTKDLSKEEVQDKLEILRRHGWILRLSGKLNEALLSQKRSLKLARDLASLKDEAMASLNIGIICQEMGIPQKGLSYWSRARRIGNKIGDRKIQTSSVNNLGTYYLHIGDLDKALEYYNEALNISVEIDDKKEIAAASLNIGNINERKGELNRAIDYYRKALSYFEELGEKESITKCLNMVGLAQLSMGNLDEAMNGLNEAVDLASKIGDKITESQARGNIGLIYAQMWQLDKAYDEFSHSLSIAQTISEPQQILAMNNDIGDIYLYKGNIRESLKFHTKALETALKIEDIFNEAMIRRSLGWDNYYAADLIKARDEFGKSHELFQKSGDRRNAIISKICQSAIMIDIDQHKTVEEMLNGIEVKAREVKDLEILAYTLENKAELCLRLRDYEKAMQISEELLNIARNIGNKRLYIWTLARMARLFFAEGNSKAADDSLDKSKRLNDELGDKILYLYNSVSQTVFAIKKSELAESLNILIKATEQARQSGAAEYVAQIELLTGQVFKKIGKDAEAKEHTDEYKKAIDSITENLTPEEKGRYVKKFFTLLTKSSLV